MKMKKKSVVHNDTIINLRYSESLSISPYSLFLKENIPDDLRGQAICDFGSGTGIIGIVGMLNGCTDIACIEKYDKHLDICIYNVYNNHPRNKDIAISIGKACPDGKVFDYIFCNPASLPSFVGDAIFFDGGKYGLDMIYEVLAFSERHLAIAGHLYLLITSILPLNILRSRIIDCGFEYTIKNSITIPFRPNYQGIAEWVDKNNATYEHEGGYYINDNHNYYEEIQLFNLTRAKT